MGVTGIRFEVSELSISKSGWTTLFVDKNFASASDDNDGYSWAMPKKSIPGAMAAAKSWCKIYVRSGEYHESVITNDGDGHPLEHVQLIGMIEDGPYAARIVATGGTGLIITGGYCEVANMAIEATDQHAIQATAPGHYFHDLAIRMANTTGADINGIWLHDSDRSEIERCHIDGHQRDAFGEPIPGLGYDKVIGVLIGDDTIEAEVHDNYITGLGDGITGVGCAAGGICVNNGYAIAIHENAQRARIYENGLVDNCVGVYFYKTGDDIFKGHSVIHNECYENCSFDFYDQYSQEIGGIGIRENFYGYSGYFVDSDKDGRADNIVNCGTNFDYAPLAAPQSWRTLAIPRGMVE